MTSALPNGNSGKRRRFAFVVFLLIWSLKLFLGILDVAGRKVPEYPDAVRSSPDIGQVELVVISSVFAGLNLLLVAFANRIPRWLAVLVLLLQVLSLLVLLLFSTGGI